MSELLHPEGFTRHLVQTKEDLGKLREKLFSGRFKHAGLDTESSAPLLRDKSTKAGKLKFRNFIDVYRSTTVGYSLALHDQTSYYIPLNHLRGNAPYRHGVELLRDLLFSDINLRIHNLGHELRAFEKLGISIPTRRNFEDTMVGAWLTDYRASAKSDFGLFGLKELTQRYLKYSMQTFREAVGHYESFQVVTPERGAYYACDDAIAALILGDLYTPRLKGWDLESWFRDVEMPFVWVLRHIEDQGLDLDVEGLLQYAKELEPKVIQAKKEFELLTGGCLISSPKQIQKLFDDGFWPREGIKKTKTGALKADAEAVELVLSNTVPGSDAYQAAKAKQTYATLSKLTSTYSHGLVWIAEQYPDGKLHTSLMHTGTETGRLSSSYPNVQNIPVRTPEGKELLKYIAAPPGYLYGSADFSQIELRVLAHFAGGVLREAYVAGKDLHQATAEQTGLTRSQGKTINFSKVYGAHFNKLAAQLGVTRDEAKRFSETYDRTIPEVSRFFAEVHQAAYKRGYVKTLGGRRRQFPLLHGEDPAVAKGGFRSVNQGLLTEDQLFKRWSEERKAGNTVCQGGAADIMKVAMVEVFKDLPSHSALNAQIHDDLRWITQADLTDQSSRLNVHEMRALVQQKMESAWDLSVPLVAEPTTGRTWYDLKD